MKKQEPKEGTIYVKPAVEKRLTAKELERRAQFAGEQSLPPG
jgi:hypothetical protein